MGYIANSYAVGCLENYAANNPRPPANPVLLIFVHEKSSARVL